MNQAPPKVSILVVTWNRREDLARCLDSALAQTYANREIVVVDNASTDGTAGFVRDCYPQVRLVCAPTNLGCPSGRNFGVPHCHGDYIYMLDDDGWLQADALERSVQRAESDPSIGVVLSRVHVVDGDRVTGCYPAGQESPAYRADFSGGCSLLRRAALDRVGLFPDGFFRQGEETDLALRLLDAGWCCFLEPASVMFHKPSPQGRDPRAFLYYTLRNANKTALRLWPMPWCLFRIGVNFLRAFQHLIARSHFLLPWQLLQALWADLGQLSQQRRPVSSQTFWLFYRLNRQPSAVRPVASRQLEHSGVPGLSAPTAP
jgi:GT2 family glycosyltransferase